MGDALLVLHHQHTTFTAAVLGRNAAWLARREMTLPILGAERNRIEADPHDVALISGEALANVVDAVGAERIGAVAIAANPGSTGLWERKGSRPFTPIILAADRRGDDLCRSFRERGWDDAFERRSGRIPDGTAAGFKLSVLLSETPRALDRAANGDLCFGSVNSYLIWRLSGSRVHAMDRTEAAASMLFNLERLCWDNELLEVFTVPPACLPTVHAPASRITETTLGSRLPAAVPLAAAVAHPQAVRYGLGCEKPGQLHAHFDYPAEIVRISGPDWPAPPRRGSVRMTLGADGSTQFGQAQPLNLCGSVLNWCKAVGLKDSPEALSAMIPDWTDPGDVRFVGHDPHSMPRSRRSARAKAFSGASAQTPDTVYACALLEAAAHEVRLAAEQLGDAGDHTPIGISGGAADIDVFLARIADLTGRRVERTESRVAAIFGAARLAASTLGWSSDFLLTAPEHTFQPRIADRARLRIVSQWGQ